MITSFIHQGSRGNSYDFYGLSTDEKPMDVSNASTFYEMDTHKIFMFDEQNKRWLEQ